jgi:hypothetical protein
VLYEITRGVVPFVGDYPPMTVAQSGFQDRLEHSESIWNGLEVALPVYPLGLKARDLYDF